MDPPSHRCHDSVGYWRRRRQPVRASRVGEYVGAGPEGALKLTVGLINLAGILLCQLEEQSGSDKSTLLQDAAAVTL
jgi:hypothetical protein